MLRCNKISERIRNLYFILLFCPLARKRERKQCVNGCNGFCCSLYWGRRPHSPAEGLWRGVETGRPFLWYPGWWLWCACCQSPGLAQSHVPAVSWQRGSLEYLCYTTWWTAAAGWSPYHRYV